MVRNGIILLGLLAFGLSAIAQRASSQISAEESYANNAPGVAMVQAVFEATVYVNKVVMNDNRFRALVDSVKRLDTSGQMMRPEEKLDIVVKALYNSPSKYLSRTTEYYRQQHRITSSGTGFFITADGYLVTNSHILDRDSAFIRRRFTMSTFEEVTEANIRSLQNSWEMTLTDQQKGLLSNAYSVVYSQVSSMFIYNLKKEIYIQLRVDRGDGQVGTMRLPAKVVIKGAAMPGKDVAILKLEGMQNLPTLALAPDDRPRIGEGVLVYGYPEPVSSNLFLARDNGGEPTLTSGIVSAIKRSVNGWPVIQMDATIAHGSSGSPVCNMQGEVCGLATFGSLQQNNTGLATGYNFAIPLSIVREFLDSVKVLPEMSLATKTYNQGIAYFHTQYYRKALEKFKAVQKINARYPYLSSHIIEAKAKMEAGLDRENFMQRFIFRIMAGVLILAGLAVFFHWQRLKRRRGVRGY